MAFTAKGNWAAVGEHTSGMSRTANQMGDAALMRRPEEFVKRAAVIEPPS